MYSTHFNPSPVADQGKCLSPYYLPHNFYLSQAPLVSPTTFANYSTPYAARTSRSFLDCSASSGYASETTFNSPFQAAPYYDCQQSRPLQPYNQTIYRNETKPSTSIANKESHGPSDLLDDILNSIKKPDYYSDGENYEFDSSDVSEQNSNKKKRVLNQNQRTAANVRERKRMTIMNDAFVDLRAVLPIKTGKKRRKMSRLDIVNGALEYIEYLAAILDDKPHVEPSPSMYNGYF
jgi:hypothetical protein